VLETNALPHHSEEIQKDLRLQTSWITPELIAYVVEKIVQEVAPQRVILFGSYARNAATEQSDLDLFIVQDSKESNREVRRRIENLLWGRFFGIDLIVRKPDEILRNLADGNPFYTHHIFKDGKVLYERPT
jgi:predicted nucleotidyltransferase